LSDQVPQFSDKLSAKAEAEKFRAPEEADRLQPAPPDTTAPNEPSATEQTH
jgi:hypothetical protein